MDLARSGDPCYTIYHRSSTVIANSHPTRVSLTYKNSTVSDDAAQQVQKKWRREEGEFCATEQAKEGCFYPLYPDHSPNTARAARKNPARKRGVRWQKLHSKIATSIEYKGQTGLNETIYHARIFRPALSVFNSGVTPTLAWYSVEFCVGHTAWQQIDATRHKVKKPLFCW